MKYFKGIFLLVVLGVSMLFVGCSQGNVNTTDKLSNDEYSEELKSITKSIFEDNTYTKKEEVEAFTQDMDSKANQDEKSNLWYYEDQGYLFMAKSMYSDLDSNLSKLTCSDEVTASIHDSIIAQLDDLSEITSTLLQEYSNNMDPKSLNSTVPEIKLIFTDNPNEYTFSNLVRNEVNGRIKRINNSIEGLTNQEVKDISKGALNNLGDKVDGQEEGPTPTENKQDNVSKAKESILQALKNTELSGKNVVLEYYPNPGAAVDGSKYYGFGAGDGDVTFDFMYLVDKNTFDVYEFDVAGNMRKISDSSSSSSESKPKSETQVNLNTNRIQGGISSKEAFEIIVNGYAPKYKYNGSPNGEISYEMYNSSEGIEEPAYMFGFNEVATGNKYIGWVYGDGDYMMRMVFE